MDLIHIWISKLHSLLHEVYGILLKCLSYLHKYIKLPTIQTKSNILDMLSNFPFHIQEDKQLRKLVENREYFELWYYLSS